jgi:hypothetical protein
VSHAAPFGIEPFPWLVENDDVGGARRECHLQAEQLAAAARQPPQRAPIWLVFLHPEPARPAFLADLRRQRSLAAEIPDRRASVDLQDPCEAGVGNHQARGIAQQRCLAGAVGAESARRLHPT